MNSGELASNKCWFCVRNPEERSANIKIELQYDISERECYDEYYQAKTIIEYKRNHLTVPRCKECKSEHEKPCPAAIVASVFSVLIIVSLSVLMAISLPISFFFINLEDSANTPNILIVSGVVLAIFFTQWLSNLVKKKSFSKGVKHLDDVKSYPPYAILISQGWKEIERTEGI